MCTYANSVFNKFGQGKTVTFGELVGKDWGKAGPQTQFSACLVGERLGYFWGKTRERLGKTGCFWGKTSFGLSPHCRKTSSTWGKTSDRRTLL